MQKITWRQIEIFHAIMTRDNLTRAAEFLHTSQPTLSRELARFEQQLAVSLFSRIGGRLQPTVQALRLFEEVERSWYGMERIRETAEGLGDFHQAELSVACLPAFSQSLLPALCQPFLERYPTVSMNIIPRESPLLEEWLSAQRYDLGLTETRQRPAGTELLPLLTVDEVCVLPEQHPLAARSQLTPQDFAGLPFISLSKDDSYRQLLDSLFREQGVSRMLRMETHSAASVCAMVKAAIGVSIINPLTALDYTGHGVVMRRFSISVPFTVSLIRPLHRPASALTGSFVRHLQQQAGIFTRQIEQQLQPPAPAY
ncbi:MULTISPECIES: LysR family transcriptional regulator [Tatumella]|uniref:LysR family transcriptional regulator n=1 Tax=Tatumella punctata TaxID=399969 RepID=A0ABW1VSI4_9GAMM|nr:MULTISPECIES: LysR family transcriptional regulator [unclassified Tatumella]MBS0855934.1 LysR family transcriptional regulator [Tatumella sp. JGM16]MBS0876942.1 LysR family transcriptional regulator [Tatumella sp. JGM82]MBS0890922.1 LysR family transcriptional regulator [Tatumella sp. JGM94]MBS0893530.1 LysR family transcriptional regulator [Tatumella sp. JGM130]MBS0901834.1 LysR family transcriptional regulator [Tatumella sp. JGM100]